MTLRTALLACICIIGAAWFVLTGLRPSVALAVAAVAGVAGYLTRNGMR